MAGLIHEIAVGRVLENFPQAKTRGFLREFMRAEPECVVEEFEDLPRVIPDAFFIDAPNYTVVVFEVEARHPVSDSKMATYADIWWVLDDFGWDLVLITVDRWGKHTAELRVAEFAVRQIVLEARGNQQPLLPSPPPRTGEMG